MTGSRCWPAVTGWRRPGSGRWRRRWSGVISCSARTSGGCSAGWRSSPARSRWRPPRRSPGQTAGPVVLHLVDCSLLAPPRTGPDGRARYLMLETLRAYGLERLAEAGEQPEAAAALARHALQVAEQAAAGMQTSAGELAAARWLDAEDATTQQALAWALEHDPPTALRLADGAGALVAAAGPLRWPGTRCCAPPPRHAAPGQRRVVRRAALARPGGERHRRLRGCARPLHRGP